MTKRPVAKRAVICVFDGLRPDRVTAELMPNLWRFATEGTWFRESRSVFPSVTRVAAASFATGSRPQSHGIVDNAFFDPSVVPDAILNTANAAHLRAAEARYDGRFVEAESFGGALEQAGKRYAVVHTGSAGTTYLVNHRARAQGHWTFAVEGPEATQTPEAVAEAVARFGPLPATPTPRIAEMAYGTKVFVDRVLTEKRPEAALIWFCEPDTAYHYRGIGSKDALKATRAVDGHFGEILDAIAAGPDAEETVVVAMSDHGQIAMTGEVDLNDLLTEAGFPTASAPGEGIEVLATKGSTCGLSLRDPDPARLAALAAVLMDLPETGMLFSRNHSAVQGMEEGREEGIVPGTLPYGRVGVDHVRAPDLFWIARSSLSPDAQGLPGTGLHTGGTGVQLGGGMHGGLHPVELNTMLAFGGAVAPALGEVSDPADLTDIVPTLLHLLDCPIPAGMTGRPLRAVTGEERQESGVQTLAAGRGGFEQRLVLAVTGDRSIPLSGGPSRGGL
ncbi:alkaline phosphatase family protein [Algihabitans albus]|uniref:alkaline phosphatase family protein n=1 Tax=Algihabitans albus TaxID=2164067 RepID=UPI0013C336B2|nr:alkaline phosphatase family protein [Algihabitans albus]